VLYQRDFVLFIRLCYITW